MEKSKPLPGLVLIAGLPASGKTWFARALAERIGAVHINSDALRTEMGLRGQYDRATKQLVYDAMKERGEAALKGGHTVVVDSTFYQRRLREPWQSIAQHLQVPVFFVVIEIPDEVAFERLEQKRKDSEADKSVYLKIKEQWEPVEAPHLTLDSSKMRVEEMVDRTLAYISTFRSLQRKPASK